MIFPFSLSEMSKSFLKNDTLSIDIGFTNIKVVHSRKKPGNTLKVINYNIGRTPQGCIKNGVISNFQVIAESLKKVTAENKISEKNVKIVISAGSNIISKIIYVLNLSRVNTEELIKVEAVKHFPVDIEAQRLFYRIIGEIEKDGQKFYKVLVTAVPKTVIDNYINLVTSINFKPSSIEIPFSSVARFFSKGVRLVGSMHQNSSNRKSISYTGSTAVVDMGSETSNLSIVNKGSLQFNRIILAGGSNLDEIIGKKLGIDKESAEVYKKVYGLSDRRHIVDRVEQIVDECTRYYLSEIFKNIKRSIEFFVEKCGGEPVERIFFIGGGSGLKGLKAFAQEFLDIPVFTVDMMDFDNIEFEKKLDKGKVRYLINAIGIAM